ncbi:hypothetical protein FOA52_012933 [Chlamydomonas sp. UWO 241]|nr:hypothetical protein FOA52_012933 [Chlamydomonas sp. UWO 241]
MAAKADSSELGMSSADHAGMAAAALSTRFCKILRRHAWGHRFVLPEDLLARAYSIVGDDSHMQTFVMKLVSGQPVHYAHLGGSISVFALAKRKDHNWHAIFHRWLELAFTPCGDEHPHLSARDPWDPYVKHIHVCDKSTVTLKNHAIGATSCLFAEKCLVQNVNATHTDWVMIEYTQNAIQGNNGESLNTAERRSLERMLRKLLRLPSRPAVTLMHSYSVNDNRQYGPLVEDWHDLVVQYYGNVQAISVRSVIYDMLRGLTAKSPEMAELRLFMPDGLHPEWFGHLVWADVMIYTFKRLAIEAMGDALLDVLAPGVRSPRQSAAPPHPREDGLTMPLPKAFTDYWITLVTRGGADGLPPPLLPHNSEDSDGFCYMADKLPALVQEPHVGWSWVDESRYVALGRHKWGYVTNTSGSKLRIQVDTTIGGLLQDPSKPRPPREASHPPRPWSQFDALTENALLDQAKQHGNLPGQAQTSGGIKHVVDTHAEAMLGYLCTYENIGKAKVTCVAGCSCAPAEMDGLWGQRYSTTYAACRARPRAGRPCGPHFVLSIPVARGANWFLAGGGRRMDEEEATAAAEERIAAAAEDGTSLPVRLATDVVRFLYGGTARREPADGGVVSASLLNAKPAVWGIGVEPRGGGVLRVLFTVASDAVGDTVVRWRHELRRCVDSTAVFDVLSDREEAQHQALWPAFLAAKVAGKRRSFLYMNVSAHEACTMEVESLEGKFKVEGVIVNARPYYWDTTATATHYSFMVTDILNNMN